MPSQFSSLAKVNNDEGGEQQESETESMKTNTSNVSNIELLLEYILTKTIPPSLPGCAEIQNSLLDMKGKKRSVASRKRMSPM